MDILLLQASAYELPTSRRVGVIVHDGTTDTRLWKGPGADRELAGAYGPDLQTMLDRERGKLPEKIIPLGGLLRVHPGRLHCDFLVWLGTREPEKGGRQSPPPEREIIQRGVHEALDFVSERHVIRIAFPALGAGGTPAEDAERLAAIAKACSAWYEARFASGRSTPLEEVLICDPRLSVVTAARRPVAALVKAATADPKPVPTGSSSGRRDSISDRPPPKAARKPASKAGSRTAKPTLDDGELAHARATAKPWDRSLTYYTNQWFIHAKFGVGQVREATHEGKIVVLFENGDTRTLVNGFPPGR